MTLNNKDNMTELVSTLKQIKAVFNLFENEFVSFSDKKTVLLTVDSGFENYQSISAVISNLIHKANQQAAELDKETDNNDIKAVK